MTCGYTVIIHMGGTPYFNGVANDQPNGGMNLEKKT